MRNYETYREKTMRQWKNMSELYMLKRHTIVETLHYYYYYHIYTPIPNILYICIQ